MRRLLCPAPRQTPSLWDTFDALTRCRERYGLSSASLAVLRALVSFLPKAPDPGPRGHMVWPSNAVLAERANGMDERTLRRHLARLVEAGLIARHASPNSKRFALRQRGQVVAVFGFDLAPLQARGAEILARLAEMEAEAETLDLLRARIRARLMTTDAETAAPIRRRLRAKASIAELETLLAGLGENLDLPATVLTGTDSQIDRHQQKAKEDSFASSTSQPKTLTPPSSSQITLTDCLDAVEDTLGLAPQPVRNWTDLQRLGHELAPMIGINADLLGKGRDVMGSLATALSVLCVIQKAERISKPAAYFQRLVQLAEKGTYSLSGMIRGTSKTRFAPANRLDRVGTEGRNGGMSFA